MRGLPQHRRRLFAAILREWGLQGDRVCLHATARAAAGKPNWMCTGFDGCKGRLLPCGGTDSGFVHPLPKCVAAFEEVAAARVAAAAPHAAPPPHGPVAAATAQDDEALQAATARALPELAESETTEAEPAAAGTSAADPCPTWEDTGLTPQLVAELAAGRRESGGWPESLCKAEANRLASANPHMTAADVATAVVVTFGGCRSLAEAGMCTPLGWDMTGEPLDDLLAHLRDLVQGDAEALATLEGGVSVASLVDEEIALARRGRAAPERVLTQLRSRLTRARKKKENAQRAAAERATATTSPEASPAKRATPSR